MEKWFIKNSNNYKLSYEKFGLNKILYKILLNRGIKTDQEIENYLNIKLENTHSPILLKDMIKGANLISSHIKKNSNIRIVGDYDVDGICSTYILFKGLKNLGGNVSYDIPDRVHDGYGINKRIVDKANKENVGLIITCDNGIAAFEAVEHAKKLSMDIIVTDHHECPHIEENGELVEKIPSADAVIDPKQKNSKYPFKDICGACVAFKLILYLYLINGKDESDVYNEFLSYLTFATICDVMPLKDENRIYVHYGLKTLRTNKDPSLNALFDACNINKENIDVYHIGFILGPTLNACGRLRSAKEALEMLLTKNYEEALIKANSIRGLNNKRQEYTNEAYEKALKIINNESLLKRNPILIVYVPKINESIIGIVAGRIKEKFYRPTIILTDSEGVIKASGRSIDEYNIFENVNLFRERLEAFGGHKMACGFSIKKEFLEGFKEDLNKNAKLTKDDLTKKIYIDYPLKFSQINMDLFTNLKRFEPYGTGNEKPIFGNKDVKIIDIAFFGTNKNVIKLTLDDGTAIIKAVLFKDGDDFLSGLSNAYGKEAVLSLLKKTNKNIKIDLIFSLEINNFRGNSNIELRVKSYRVSGDKNDN